MHTFVFCDTPVLLPGSLTPSHTHLREARHGDGASRPVLGSLGAKSDKTESKSWCPDSTECPLTGTKQFLLLKKQGVLKSSRSPFLNLCKPSALQLLREGKPTSICEVPLRKQILVSSYSHSSVVESLTLRKLRKHVNRWKTGSWQTMFNETINMKTPHSVFPWTLGDFLKKINFVFVCLVFHLED